MAHRSLATIFQTWFALMFNRLSNSWWALLALLLLMPLGACNCNNSASDSAGEDSESASNGAASAEAEEPDDESGAEQAADDGDAPPTDLYPGMNFGQLNGEQRTKFVDIAEAEVCPCPDTAESLHSCLQERATTCGLAQQVAGLIGSSIQQGFSETDILDRVAEQVEAAQKQYDFTLEGVPHKGPEDAPVTVVEFADFECPHCRTASAMMEQISEKYDEQVAIYFKQFPLQSHGNAEKAARASLAAHRQGKFWKMHDLIFENQQSLSGDKFDRFANRLGLNVSKFQQDMNGQEVSTAVQRDKKEGEAAGITGTPALFINGRRYAGELQPAAISQAIEAELAAEEGDDEQEGGDGDGADAQEEESGEDEG